MTLTRGTRLGPYEIIELVGAGGMGEVYRAHDPRIGRDVAIKILPAAYASDPDRLRRFELETRATGLLNHPNILTIYDTGRLEPGDIASSAPFIVTELLEGQTLRDELNRGRLSPRRAIEYAMQIARGLAAAHAKGIVHRDLKPENVFVTADGRVKILDFGIAKLRALGGHSADASTTASATVAGLVVGTADYMSPEQARGEAIDHRSDLFALGVIVYEMIAGDRPFKGATAADRVSAMLRDDPASLPHVSSEVPDNLERIIRHSLEKVPDRRFQSASDFIFDLETLPATTLKAAAHAGDRLRRRPTTRTVLLAASILTVGAVAAWLYMTGSRAPGSARRPAATARVTPFLASEALEDHPAWSPTGNLMAYVSDAAGSADVWICDPSGTNPINLTAAFPGTDSMPAWSPDGQRLAFYSDRDGGGIYTMNALGGDVRRVIPIKPGVLYTFSLAWSRDNSLVYTNFHDQGKKDVFRIAPSGAPASCLTCGLSSERGARSGELSPSGELLLYKTGEMGARGALQILHLASRRVVHVFDQVDRPRWSADGRRVIFISGQDGTPDLWQIEIDPATGNPAGEPERLTSGLAVSSFAIAPGDQQILAVTQKSHGNLWTFPGSAERVTDLAAGERWTTGQFLDTRGRWLPDGGGVLFQSNRRGSLDIWALASPTGQLSRLTSGAGAEHRPRVAPDGQWIAFDVIDGAGEYVHIMRRDGSGVRLPDDGWRQRFSMTCCAAWSPDGTRLAMHINASGTAIVRIDPTTGAAIETTEIDLPGQADEYHRWSPDGTRVVYEALTDGTWDLWVARPDGSESHRLTNSPGSERSAAWHPRLPFIYFESDGRTIWRVAIDASARATGPPELWLTLPDRLEAASDGIDFTANGDRILVTLLERASDIWLVESDSGAAR